MKRKMNTLILVVFLLTSAMPAARADLPTFDAVNAALNQLRNFLMQSQFVQDIELAMERLNQLKAQYLELVRFNSGLDDFFEVLIGDPLKEMFGNVRDAYRDSSLLAPELETLGNSSDVHEIRTSLEAITGAIPPSNERHYIPFEEMQIVEGFQLAQKIREAGQDTRAAASAISEQAKTASPKGAVKLQAEALSQMMVLSQQNQEAMAKLLELEATLVGQISREDKRLEQERLKFTEDAQAYLQQVLTGAGDHMEISYAH